ncbi:MAG: glutaredoxin family protein [Thermodesulfobacteriota bacterium]|nr:MAG: glutaredoxin family protein [Thermodesulfobacteriota bacterium]
MEKVLLYALSTCPWCRKAKKLFNELNVEFDFVDYDLAGEDEQARIREEIKGSGADFAFPWVRIDGRVVEGYNPEEYRELLGIE